MNYELYTLHWQSSCLLSAKSWSPKKQRRFPDIINDSHTNCLFFQVWLNTVCLSFPTFAHPFSLFSAFLCFNWVYLKSSEAIIVMSQSTLSHNAETKEFARLTSHSVLGWTGKNKAFCSPGTQNGHHVIGLFYHQVVRHFKVKLLQ